MSGRRDLAAVFLRWTWWRAVLHNGWWLVTSAYLVVDANLTPSQLVLIGVAQGVVALTFEIPAGVLADTLSRKWALVVSHALMGTAMLATGLVTGYGPLVATQMLWGLSWTFGSGADVAWITDELDDPGRISVVLVRAGRAQLTGAAAGIVGVGALGWLVGRSTAMILAGAAMLLLGLYVVVRFRERRFVAARARRWSASFAVLARGTVLVRRSRAILVIFAATFLVNGAWVAYGRMQPRLLVDLGLPSDPVVWFAGLGFLALVYGAVALRVVEPHVDSVRAARRGYVVACTAGALGAVGLAAAPEEVSASAAVLLVAGIAMPLTRTIGTIWVNRETEGAVRATVHSLLAQAEYVGEILCGLGIAAVAGLAGPAPALATCAALFTLTALLVRRSALPRRRATSYHHRVAYDEELAARIRALIGDEPALTEKQMFGGLAFLIGGNMAVGASGQGGILVRADPEQSEELVATSSARLMEMRGREMRGWLRVDAEDVRDDSELARWVELGAAYARSLPAK